MNLRSASNYARELRPLLSPKVFAPARSRLLWLPAHLLTIGLASSAVISGFVSWPIGLVLSLVIGASFAGLTFVGHEALHGALVRDKGLRRTIGYVCFFPFAVSPRLWEAWHNRIHHGNTNRPGIDPDAYPTLQQYESSVATRRGTDWVAPGRSRLAGALSLFFGFSVHSAHVLLTARTRGMLTRSQRRLALAESAVSWAFVAGLAFVVGPIAFLLIFIVPLLVGNFIIMSFILTNHSLSPHTEVNDPLVNSLSITFPRLVDWLTLGFGYHVEHHLFPAMSARHARELRALIRHRWPERYQSLSYFSALCSLHRTPRVYATDTVLVDPRTGVSAPTLGH